MKKLYIVGIVFLFIGWGAAFVFADNQTSSARLTLEQTVDRGLQENLRLRISREAVEAADAARKSQKTNFYPTFSSRYSYQRFDEVRVGSLGTLSPEEEYNLGLSVSQTLFSGFALRNQYRISRLGLDAAHVNEDLARQDLIFEAHNVYFSVLKAQKLLQVAEETVKQIDAQRAVAENFYQVGMTPLNDLLQAEVRLANAKLELTVAQNNLAAAESEFNTFLRLPINTGVDIEDVRSYEPFKYDLEFCQNAAAANRLELKLAELDVEISALERDLSKKDYFPTVTLDYNYFRRGDEFNVNGGDGIFNEDGWDIQAIASWNFWEWGRTNYNVLEQERELNQSQLQQTELQDNVRLEVKQAYLLMREAETNIITAEKAIEQAQENLRINEERYREQVATATDVLIAQTLLTNTRTNYYNALYDFKISKAALLRAMGQESLE